MDFVKQNKGKEISKIPSSKLVNGAYYYSTKLDGHYTQIVYDHYLKEVKFYTSSGKEFYIKDMADYIIENFKISFHVECEYLHGCEGKLGDRGKSAKLTTYRTEFAKGKKPKGDVTKDKFVVLDVVDTSINFSHRLFFIQTYFLGKDWFKVPSQKIIANLHEARELAKKDVKRGFEGGMLKAPDHMYTPGKRVNNIVKLKPRKTADLLCIDTTEGEGKYEGMIGALVLKDYEGRVVQVGSGLSDYDRSKSKKYYIGEVIEIEYEQILDTYIQPIFKYVRFDKDQSDIG
jgi:ATP-dependent DNA ligase